jgi:hypothetical protein
VGGGRPGGILVSLKVLNRDYGCHCYLRIADANRLSQQLMRKSVRVYRKGTGHLPPPKPPKSLEERHGEYATRRDELQREPCYQICGLSS